MIADDFWHWRHIILTVGWVWTTLSSFYFTAQIVGRLAHEQSMMAYVSDTQRLTNLVYNAAQLIANILFAINIASINRQHEWPDGYNNLSAAEAYALTIERRQETADPFTHPGAQETLTFQSLVLLMLFMRGIFFFRGFLAFGALVFLVVEVVKQMVPFLCLLLILTIGFTLASFVLLQHLYPAGGWKVHPHIALNRTPLE